MTSPNLTLTGGSRWRTPIHVGTDLIGNAGLWDDLLPPGARVGLVTDEHVAEVALDAVREGLGDRPVDVTIVPPGEAAKSRAQKAAIEDNWISGGIGRDGFAVALGGGVVGDLAGYCAATYLRGIPVVQVPTSLVAMVDSSIGGKTGIDIPAGKNLVGAFHPPLAVIADTAVLESLPESELRHGLAEVVKHGVIADAGLITAVEGELDKIFLRDRAVLADLVERNIRIKGNVVEQDEREGGLRQILNFGHTIGHALERLSAFGLPHGAAVALGMVAELAMAGSVRGFSATEAERVQALLDRIGLPVAMPDPPYSAADVLAAAGTDKKVRRGQVRYALPDRLGGFDPEPGEGYAVPVPEATATAAVARLFEVPAG